MLVGLRYPHIDYSKVQKKDITNKHVIDRHKLETTLGIGITMYILWKEIPHKPFNNSN